MEIRAMTQADIEPMVAFAALMHRESRYKTDPLDPDKLRRLGEAILAQPARWCGLVAYRGGILVGMMIGYANEPYFGPGLIAGDLALFVTPDQRGGVASAALVRAFEAWARDAGARAVQLGITTGVHQARTAALYRRLGFAPFGIVCRKSLTGG